MFVNSLIILVMLFLIFPFLIKFSKFFFYFYLFRYFAFSLPQLTFSFHDVSNNNTKSLKSLKHINIFTHKKIFLQSTHTDISNTYKHTDPLDPMHMFLYHRIFLLVLLFVFLPPTFFSQNDFFADDWLHEVEDSNDVFKLSNKLSENQKDVVRYSVVCLIVYEIMMMMIMISDCTGSHSKKK